MSDDQPRVGFYEIRRVKNGPLCGARIWRPCRCTVNGGVDQLEHPWRPSCDRFPQMQGLIDGNEADPLAIWLHGAAIDAARYNYLLAARPFTGAATKKVAPDKIDPKRFAP